MRVHACLLVCVLLFFCCPFLPLCCVAKIEVAYCGIPFFYHHFSSHTYRTNPARTIDALQLGNFDLRYTHLVKGTVVQDQHTGEGERERTKQRETKTKGQKNKGKGEQGTRRACFKGKCSDARARV